jgi:hypothetical protein
VNSRFSTTTGYHIEPNQSGWLGIEYRNLYLNIFFIKSAARLVLKKKWSDPISNDICESLNWLIPSSMYKKVLLTAMHKLMYRVPHNLFIAMQVIYAKVILVI